MRVRREVRAEDDGFRSELVPGLRASADAGRLAEEIAFSAGRLLALALDPPGLYGELRALAASDLERASWSCFMAAYLCPLDVAQDEDPFAGIRRALACGPAHGAPSWAEADGHPRLPELQDIPLGPRTSHDPARGNETPIAYLQWVARGGTAAAGHAGEAGARGSTQEAALVGDPGWSPERRFERLFERLALPGFGRAGRYDLLVTLGRLGLYELRPDSLHLAGARGLSTDDATATAAKRVFGIADPMLLERRAAGLAEACAVPLEAFDVALSNWAAPQRATLGCPEEASDEQALERAWDVLGL